MAGCGSGSGSGDGEFEEILVGLACRGEGGAGVLEVGVEVW